MKQRTCILAATSLGAAALLAGQGVAANAATSVHQSSGPGAAAAFSGNYWADQENGEDLYYDSGTGTFITEKDTSTLIGTATDCSDGWCEHKLADGECLEWESGPNTISQGTCSGIDRQFWTLVTNGGGYEWTNEYANTNFKNKGDCPTGHGATYAPYMTADTTGVDMRCPLGSGGSPTNSQVWN
jgi:hypothetical protein